jgi:hypothetical protein
MRTKTLLLTAAVVAAGVITSSAQQVFSANAVGYVNLALGAGYSMIANPLNGTNNNLSTILPTVPDGTQILKFDPAQQRFSDTVPSYIDGFGWFPDGVLAPGEGAFILLPSAATLTFIGEVPQGDLSHPVAAGYSIQASEVPQAGQLTTQLNFPAADGDQVFRFDSANQTYFTEVPSFIDGFGWFPTEPVIAVGESFFVLKGAAATWTRTFSVNN